MVKHLQVFEDNRFKIAGEIIAFIDVQLKFLPLKSSISLTESQ